jgi:hypothetical protein
MSATDKFGRRFLAGLLCALLVYHRRQPRGVERVAWWLTLNAFGLLTLSVVGDYFTPWMDQAFMIGVGAIMLFLPATTLLGVMLIKNRFRPRGTAVIMVAAAAVPAHRLDHLARQHLHSVPMGNSDRRTPHAPPRGPLHGNARGDALAGRRCATVHK